LSDKGFEKVELIFFSTAGTSTRVQSALTVAKRGSMEAPDLINNRYSMSRGPVKQQQFGSEIQSNNSNNNNNINVKHYGAGGHSHAMPRPAYSPSPISGHKRDSSGFDVGRGSSPASVDGGNFVKLFVGHVPRTVAEDDIRQLFAEHGHVLEVNMVREKRIGQQHD